DRGDDQQHQRERERDAELVVVQRQRVGADPEERGVAERQLAGKAADQVPGQAERGEQRDVEQHVEVVVPLEQRHQQAQAEAGGGEQSALARHTRWLPNSPAGLSDSTSRKITKSTTVAHWLPQYRLVRLSITPSTTPAIAAPSIDPMPPSTTITNDR